MRFTVWNPLTSRTPMRLQEICYRMARNDFIILIGTHVRTIDDVSVHTQRVKKFVCYHFGYSPSANMSNKACGVSILIKHSFAPFVSRVFHPPKHMAGRGGALRIKYGLHDFLIGGWYLPPCTGTDFNKRVSTGVLRWVRSVCDVLPVRCTPIWGCDNNGDTGIIDPPTRCWIISPSQ